MKSFGTYRPPETVGIEFQRLATPRGKQLPHAPVVGELYTLEADMPKPVNGTPWYLKGTYVFSGFLWHRLSDPERQRKATPIGSRNIEFQRPGAVGVAPKFNDGQQIAAATITPSNKQASFSGTASLWLDHSVGGNVWLSVFRNKQLVGLTLDYIEPHRPRTVSLSFLDHPASADKQLYTLTINTDAPSFVYINQSIKFGFDGISQTAFIVAENL